MKTKICFIINPIAGLGIQKINRNEVLAIFNKNQFDVTFKETEYCKHARLLTQEALKENNSIIVACGGDGTINEIAGELVGTQVILGIVPIGSGNGLAKHLEIPTNNIYKALQKIVTQHIEQIDIGKVNGYYFFSNMGIGFDTQVLKTYKRIKNRPMYSYIKAVVTSLFNYKNMPKIKVKVNDCNLLINPFLFMIANTNQLGYNISLHRNAMINDGQLDLIIIKKQPKYKLVWLGLLMILKQEKYFNGIVHYVTKNIEVEQLINTPYYLQKDGELIKMKASHISVNILDKALKVIN